MSDLKYWIAFNCIPGIGRVKFSKLEEYFGSMQSAWQANAAEMKAAGLDAKSISNIVHRRSNINIDEILDQLTRYNITALTWHDEKFPRKLKEIYDVPPVLYVRGNLLPDDEWAVAVVGSRHATIYGKEVTRQIVTDLARNKITIVSGLARGIDTVAHRAALEAGGRTIAVFGCGLDMVYPGENMKLAQSIIENGAIISDYPPGTKPKAENFPRRNRIMSGISLGVLAIEAAKNSGALITTDLALEQNREVFAVPGSIMSPLSWGTNKLIQDGAKLVQNVKDVLEELNCAIIPQQLEFKNTFQLDSVEKSLIDQLSNEPIHIDEICRLSNLPIVTVSSLLSIMEIKGVVRGVGGMNYVLANNISM